ncbi:VOC family protein [Motilimonas pumila]|uniref:VOC family protein n=1 Tax=Motilimonas pumila TaxID=2303987 RepID=A0A418YDN9_9GAMM|nr:VOC family protein [Motilimonas pumila]RJG42624.1 VOC family protein [Motilimonas pumila]
MNNHNKINYIELPAQDLAATKAFFHTVFQWQFSDFGNEYSAFSGAGLAGGFYLSKFCSNSQQGACLVVIYSHDLAQTQAQIEQAGGRISQPIFDFPGGQRFHFIEPSGNELAVWSDQDLDNP